MITQTCRHFGPYVALIIAVVLLSAFQREQAVVETTVLYDGALGGTPDTQHFAYLALGGSAAQTYENGVTTLDTMAAQVNQAGYFADDHPPLDRQTGYKLLFTIQIDKETHASFHRAGFSLIALSSDLQGIELGFWTNEIWAQEGGTDALFTHAEGVNVDTTTLTSYELAIGDDAYVLTAGGSEILSGPLRDYTALESLIDPYETPNLLFLGDNTTSAAARVNIAYAAVETKSLATSTPSPTATAPPTAAATATATAAATAAPTATPTATTMPPVATITPVPQPTREWNWWFPFTSGYPAP